MLQKQNNNLESILGTQAKEFQNLSNQITYMNKSWMISNQNVVQGVQHLNIYDSK
jgi:hypothetical protein